MGPRVYIHRLVTVYESQRRCEDGKLMRCFCVRSLKMLLVYLNDMWMQIYDFLVLENDGFFFLFSNVSWLWVGLSGKRQIW